MLLIKYIENQVFTPKVVFEYGYYGSGGAFFKDEALSCSGSKDAVLVFLNQNPMFQFLYACSGECNDFEVCKEEDVTILRFIDFR